MLSFEDFSLKAREEITQNLKEFFEQQAQENLPQYFYDLELISALSNLVPKGKLVRGTLFLFACEMYGVKEEKSLTDIACAIELLHTGLLIHDDIIDNDDLRRGVRTIHASYRDRGGKLGAISDSHYGISMGLLAGDLAFHYALELLASYKGENLGRLLKYYGSEIIRVGLAEGADVELGQTTKEPTTEDIKGIYQYKTARYTFSMPFTMAGIIAGVDDGQIETMDKLGELVGFIFQLKDDELGLVGTEEQIGKPVGSDIRENKKTLVRKLLFDKASEEERRMLFSLFGKEAISAEEVEVVKQLINKYTIQDEIDQQVGLILEEIQKLFQELRIEKEYKDVLQEMFSFNLRRKY